MRWLSRDITGEKWRPSCDVLLVKCADFHAILLEKCADFHAILTVKSADFQLLLRVKITDLHAVYYWWNCLTFRLHYCLSDYIHEVLFDEYKQLGMYLILLWESIVVGYWSSGKELAAEGRKIQIIGVGSVHCHIVSSHPTIVSMLICWSWALLRALWTCA